MVANIISEELKYYRKSTLIWVFSIGIGVVIFMMLFPAFAKDVEASRKLLSSFPAALRSVLNLSLENFFTVLGFYSYLLTFIVISGAVYAMNLGAGIISKEVSLKTADFLLTKPVTRMQVVLSKIMAAFILLIFFNLAFIGVSLLAASLVTLAPFSYGTMFLLSLTMFWIQLFFLAMGALFAVLIPKIKSVISVSLPTVFTFYIISALGSVLGNEEIRYLTPFKFFETDYIISHGAYELRYMAVGAGFITLAFLACFIIFIKKDIEAAG
jgi:ABC-2 type transport system permease protein